MNYRIKNLTGQKFSRLTALEPTDKRSNGSVVWLCQCDCGEMTEVRSSNLQNGNTKSHGCLDVEAHTKTNKYSRAFKHGQAIKGKRTKEYKTYASAKSRCEWPKNDSYNRYGGRGIKFKFNCFEEFYKEIGDAPSKKYSIDRIDPYGHYEIGNVRWVTRKEQQNNKRK